MQGTQDLLRRAASALARGDLPRAERDCRELLAQRPDHAEGQHLLGLVRSEAGDLANAESLLRSSIELAPRQVEFRLNLAKLLSAADRPVDAETAIKEALTIEPRSRPARLALARALYKRGAYQEAEAAVQPLVATDKGDAEAWVLIGDSRCAQGNDEAAEASYRSALAARPDHRVANHNLGALLSKLSRAEESLAALDRAASLGTRAPALHINRSRALQQLGRFDEADAVLAAALQQWPTALEAHVMLAKLRHMRGDADYVRHLATAARATGRIELYLALGDLLRRGGRLREAHDVVRPLADSRPEIPEILSSLAVVLQELGELETALLYARRSHEARTTDAEVAENVVAILLQLGRPDEAQPLIGSWRGRSPLDGRWLAYEATAARQLGQARYGELYAYDRFVRTFDLDPPSPYSSMAAFNADLARALEARHLHNAHPLDQSLRHGTQTPRSLLADRDPLIDSFLALMREPLLEYVGALGADEAHPFLRRNRGAVELSGCWSVRLHDGGYHVNHLHPQGWISSAYYVALPRETGDSQSKSGWIKFGEPRMPTPRSEAAYSIEPRVGRLVLFPSYMWHGTTPIHGPEPRLTIAFDAIPRDR
jgi:tetratricopeptide (TPR) repeat protein